MEMKTSTRSENIFLSEKGLSKTRLWLSRMAFCLMKAEISNKHIMLTKGGYKSCLRLISDSYRCEKTFDPRQLRPSTSLDSFLIASLHSGCRINYLLMHDLKKHHLRTRLRREWFSDGISTQDLKPDGYTFEVRATSMSQTKKTRLIFTSWSRL